MGCHNQNHITAPYPELTPWEATLADGRTPLSDSFADIVEAAIITAIS